MQSFILVANGPAVMQKKMGVLIDSFDNVVRFNNFETAGFEEYVGRKTNILARRACDDVNMIAPDTIDHVMAFMTYCPHSSFMGPVAKHLQNFYRDKCEIVPVSKCKEYGEVLRLEQPDSEWATVGVLTILHLLQTCDKLHLYGFDYTITGKHYFQRQPKDSKYHAWKKEADFVNRLTKEGKVIHVGLS